MPAQTTPPDPRVAAVAALAATLAEPTARVLFGTRSIPGFFKGQGAAAKRAAELCVQERWLEETGEKSGSGARAKALYRLTPRGVGAVLKDSPALAILQSLEAGVRGQQQSLEGIRAAVEHLSNQIASGRLEHLLEAALRKLAPPDIEALVQRLTASSHRPGAPSPAWREEVVRRARAADTSHPLSLPELFRALKATWADLNLGQFHEGLRALRDAGRIRLQPYTRAYAEIADRREALFLDGEVMYYVRSD